MEIPTNLLQSGFQNACFSRVVLATHVGGFSKMLWFVAVSFVQIPRVPLTDFLKSGFAGMLVFLRFCKIHMSGASQKYYVL